MKRKGTADEAEEPTISLTQHIHRLGERVARAAELILLSGVFGYAAVKSQSTAAGIVAILLSCFTAVHIGLGFAIFVSRWISDQGRSTKNRFLKWAIEFSSLLVVMAIATVSILAVIALADVIVATANP